MYKENIIISAIVQWSASMLYMVVITVWNYFHSLLISDRSLTLYVQYSFETAYGNNKQFEKTSLFKIAVHKVQIPIMMMFVNMLISIKGVTWMVNNKNK